MSVTVNCWNGYNWAASLFHTYAEIGATLGMPETEVLKAGRLNKRPDQAHGVIVKHHQLGYRANAMIVWNIQIIL